jgi:hypothetical protein
MIDVKKLITGFLIVACIAICSGFLFSSLLEKSPTTTQNSSGISIAGAGSSGSAPSGLLNAFVDTGSVQGNAAEILNYVDTSSTDALASDPDNLTNVFADSFIDGLNTANPDGITADQSGTPELSAPNTAAIAQEIASSQAVQNMTVPDWDTEAQFQPIKITSSSSPSAITQYSASLNSILNEYFVSNGLQSQIDNQTVDPSTFPYVYSEIKQALSDTLAIQTPAPLVGLQKSLVTVMVYEKNSVQLAESAGDDPVKTSLILEDEQNKYSSALANLQQQMQKAAPLGVSFNDSTQIPIPIIAKIFGVQPAYAQWITFDPNAFGQLLLDELNKTILQILKNTLTSLIQKKVLTAIQGSGAPKFVTSFAKEMVNAYQSAAIKTINTEIGQAPANQQTGLKALTALPYTAPNASSSLGTVGPNPGVGTTASSSFANFGDYLSEYNSGGNIWANALAIHDNAMIAGSNNQAAKTTQNIAQQGFTGSETCTDGSDPVNGYSMQCDDGLPPYSDGTCPDNDTPEWLPNAGLCANGSQPKITTPGQITGQMANTAVNTGSANITSADGIAGLLNALTDSLLNSLSQSAINYANSAVNGVLNSHNNSGLLGISTSTPTSTASSSAQTGVQCIPSIQPAAFSTSTFTATANVSAGGGAIDTTCAVNGNCPTTENSDGSPIYNWSAPGSVQGGSGTTVLSGSSLILTYTARGTYYATVTASTDYSQAKCEIDVQ